MVISQRSARSWSNGSRLTPGDLSALDRLIDLHKKGGQPALAAEVLQKRNAVRELLDRYMMLHGRKQPIRDAEELATIAEQLGRGFEARGFLTIAVFQEPGRKDLREKLRTFDSRLPTLGKGRMQAMSTKCRGSEFLAVKFGQDGFQRL